MIRSDHFPDISISFFRDSLYSNPLMLSPAATQGLKIPTTSEYRPSRTCQIFSDISYEARTIFIVKNGKPSGLGVDTPKVCSCQNVNTKVVSSGPLGNTWHILLRIDGDKGIVRDATNANKGFALRDAFKREDGAGVAAAKEIFSVTLMLNRDWYRIRGSRYVLLQGPGADVRIHWETDLSWLNAMFGLVGVGLERQRPQNGRAKSFKLVKHNLPMPEFETVEQAETAPEMTSDGSSDVVASDNKSACDADAVVTEEENTRARKFVEVQRDADDWLAELMEDVNSQRVFG